MPDMDTKIILYTGLKTTFQVTESVAFKVLSNTGGRENGRPF